MSGVLAWRPGAAFSEDAIMALLRETRRGTTRPKEAVVYLRAALREADRIGDTESAARILPFLAITCQVTGATAEAIWLNRRRRRFEPGPESLDFLVELLRFKGLVRAALRAERQAKVLGFHNPRREHSLLTAVERSLLPVGPLLSIHHDGKRMRPSIPSADGATIILEERGRQERTVHPYTIRWTGEGNDLLNVRRWRLDIRGAGDPAAFLDLTRRLAHRMDGVVFDPKNKVLRASAARFFVPESELKKDEG